jgi:LmbE family N-acetylglucosaminyl deacetylase
MANPYSRLVSKYTDLLDDSRSKVPTFSPKAVPSAKRENPTALIFSPHPDDEAIVGGLALRLLREAKWNVINVAVTAGSKKSRRLERLNELRKACGFLEFGLIVTDENGLESINTATRSKHIAQWSKPVDSIAAILRENQPRVIFVPHEDDGHDTHIGTHHLVMDALAKCGTDFECWLVETEFWKHMAGPNLLVEISPKILADLMMALSFHVGEIKRNPYHLSLPAWMIDNARRAEMVIGTGSEAPKFAFGTLYRLRKWQHGQVVNVLKRGKILSDGMNPALLFK